MKAWLAGPRDSDFDTPASPAPSRRLQRLDAGLGAG